MQPTKDKSLKYTNSSCSSLPKKKKKKNPNKKWAEALWKIVWRFLRKLTLELPYDPAISLLGIYPNKTIIEKIHIPYVHNSSTHNSQDLEAT